MIPHDSPCSPVLPVITHVSPCFPVASPCLPHAFNMHSPCKPHHIRMIWKALATQGAGMGKAPGIIGNHDDEVVAPTPPCLSQALPSTSQCPPPSPPSCINTLMRCCFFILIHKSKDFKKIHFGNSRGESNSPRFYQFCVRQFMSTVYLFFCLTFINSLSISI